MPKMMKNPNSITITTFIILCWAVGILNNFGEKKSHLGFIEKLWQMTMHH